MHVANIQPPHCFAINLTSNHHIEAEIGFTSHMIFYVVPTIDLTSNHHKIRDRVTNYMIFHKKYACELLRGIETTTTCLTCSHPKLLVTKGQKHASCIHFHKILK
jgi:hypothetical protein